MTQGRIDRKADIIAAVTRALESMDETTINGVIFAVSDQTNINGHKGGDSLVVMGLTNWLSLKAATEAGFIGDDFSTAIQKLGLGGSEVGHA